MTDKGNFQFSIVSPVYRAENILEELVNQISLNIEKITSNYEIILVDDASPDDSWKKIEQISELNSHVTGYRLSRNFGQHYAITAGLSKAKGDWIIVMDCDLQDRPEEFENLYTCIKTQNLDLALASRVNRQDSFLKRLSSKVFYAILSYLTGTKQDSTIANFGIYSKKVIDSILTMGDKIRYFPSMINWVGFKSAKIPVAHSKRTEGNSNYSFKKLFNLGLDIILAFSDKPIRIMVKFGLLVASTSIIFAIYNLLMYLNGKIIVQGYASLIISIWFFSGIIILILGIVGLYVGKTFENVKNRPTFIISEQTKSK